MADITITEGNTLEVDYSVENTGDGTGDQDIRLAIESVLEDTDANVVLDPGQTATGTLAWPTVDGDEVVDALAEALTDDTSDSITVTVASAIPDSVVTRYTFEDDSDTTTATDAVGSNDATLNGGSFSSDASAGSFAWSSDGTDDYGISQNTVDLSASGDTVGASVGGRLKPSKTGAFQFCVGWDTGSDYYLYVGITDTDAWRAAVLSGTGTFQSISGGSIDTTAYTEVIAASDNTDLWLLVDGTEVARTDLASSGADITTIGAANLTLARQETLSDYYYGGLSDNPSYLDEAIEASQSDGAV